MQGGTLCRIRNKLSQEAAGWREAARNKPGEKKNGTLKAKEDFES